MEISPFVILTRVGRRSLAVQRSKGQYSRSVCPRAKARHRQLWKGRNHPLVLCWNLLQPPPAVFPPEQRKMLNATAHPMAASGYRSSLLRLRRPRSVPPDLPLLQLRRPSAAQAERLKLLRLRLQWKCRPSSWFDLGVESAGSQWAATVRADGRRGRSRSVS